MEDLLTIGSLISLLTLTILEIILGIDNVIFVSIILGRIPEKDRLKARRLWMVLGILLRSGLLIGLGWLVANGESELFRIEGYGFNLRNMIMFFGGLFLLYKAVKEIHHKLEGADEEFEVKNKVSSFGAMMTQIVLVDAVFSFDSIVTAIGLAQHIEIMIAAVVIAMIVMFFFASGISGFIEKHPALKMLALSFLVMVGFMLFFEGLEPIHGSHIPKGYAYVAMAFSFGVELLNMKARKRRLVKLDT
ncbi:MAG: TerC family protein [Flavobacteriales bacterium]|jgi:predicted tellurium resistance membrane protein TerC|nr:TerC family protein [Flavobacteriales bacterium]MBK6549403.1 TerC family protein [Flavobacteriales bacterium]MBK6884009.1 TerC family protein [Flavobacteriales bacterium]MBK7100399.1 TerC family protein [Flavobacteriales bacterium]MBK7111094.1 TerC family protein [Flavobacteriales bacterium]